MYERFETDELLALAQFDAEKKDLESALRKLKIVLTDKEPPVKAFSMAARLYAQLSLFDKAKIYYEKFLASHPDSELERFQLGMIHFDMNQLDAAVQEWDRVLAGNSGFPPALYYKGLVCVRQEKIDQARANLNNLLRIAAPDNMYFGRARDLLAALERSNPDNAADISPDRPEPASKSAKKLPKGAYKTKH